MKQNAYSFSTRHVEKTHDTKKQKQNTQAKSEQIWENTQSFISFISLIRFNVSTMCISWKHAQQQPHLTHPTHQAHRPHSYTWGTHLCQHFLLLSRPPPPTPFWGNSFIVLNKVVETTTFSCTRSHRKVLLVLLFCCSNACGKVLNVIRRSRFHLPQEGSSEVSISFIYRWTPLRNHSTSLHSRVRVCTSLNRQYHNTTSNNNRRNFVESRYNLIKCEKKLLFIFIDSFLLLCCAVCVGLCFWIYLYGIILFLIHPHP